MTQQQSNDPKQQKTKGQNANDKKQDIKNAEYIAHIDQPNHPNT